MRTPVAVLATCVLLAVTACGTSSADNAIDDKHPPTMGNTAIAKKFGQQHRFDSGMSFTVSKPMSFQPSDAARPPANNAVTFDITVRNKTDQAYQLSDMSAEMSYADTQAEQISDPTQGYTGIQGSADGLPAGRKTRFSLAYAAPTDPVELTLTLVVNNEPHVELRYSGESPPTRSQ